MNTQGFIHRKHAITAMLLFSLLVLLALPVVPVSAAPLAAPAIDGDGTMTVDITSAEYGSSQTFVFTFTAVNDFAVGSQVTLTVPAGWTTPTTAAGDGQVTVTNGTCTSAVLNGITGTGPWTVVVDMECLDTQTFTVSYVVNVVTAGVATSPHVFTTQTKYAGGTLANIASHPSISITPKTLTVTGITVTAKTYNGLTNATLSGTGTLSGKVGTDDVTLTGTPVGTFSDKNVGVGKTVTISGLSLSGTTASNYTLTQPTRLGTINAKALTIGGVTANNKVYDGTVTATFATNSPSVSGVIAGDDATLSGTATNPVFGTKSVGTNKTVSYTGLSMIGLDAGNYTLTQSTTANVTAKPITITAVEDTKVYDRLTTSSPAPIITPGLATGDTIGTIKQAFATITAGTGKTITPSGKAVDGNSGNNYTYTYVSIYTGAITPKPLTVSGLTANNKTYDGTDTAALSGVPSLNGVISPDVATLGGTAAGTFADKHVGSGKTVTISGLSITGTDAGNYALEPISTIADITTLAITITAVSDTKPYDGTTSSSGIPTIAPALASGDGTGTISQTFDTANAGTGKTLTPAGLVEDGNNGNNYAYTYTAAATGTINQILITITASDADMAFGTTPPTITPIFGAGFVTPDTSAVLTSQPVCSTTATNASPVGTYSSSCSGAAATNYTFTYVDGTVNVILSWVLSTPADGANLLDRRPVFDWGDYEGATGYTLQLAKNPGFSSPTTYSTTPSYYIPTADLIANTLYYWRVQAKLPNGVLSPWSDGYSFTTANPPSMPSLVTPAANYLVSGYTPLLDWSDSTLPTGTYFGQYRVEVSKTSTFAPANTATYTTAEDLRTGSSSAFFVTPMAALDSNSTYYWRVRAENDLGEYSPWTAFRSFRTALLPPTLGLPAPGVLNTKRPTFTWTNAVTNPPQVPTGYTVQVSTASNFGSYAENVTVTGTTFTPGKDLTSNTLYYWRVCANGANGPSAWVVGTFTSGNPATTPAAQLPASNALMTSLTPMIDWTTSTLPSGTTFVRYELQVDNNTDFSSPEVSNNSITIIGNSAYTLTTNLAYNTKYYWRVRAVNLVSSVEHFSAWSTVAYFRTVLQAPTLRTPNSTTPPQNSLRPTLSWNAVVGATGYEIQVSTNGGVSYSVLATNVAGPNYTPTANLLPNTTYNWKVRSLGYNGPSAFSTAAVFRTSNPPSIPNLVAPVNIALNQPLTVTLDWSTSTLPEGSFARYEVQVDNNSNFVSPEINNNTTLTVLANSMYVTTPLATNTKYFWRVRAVSLISGMESFSAWSSIYYFTTIRLAAPILTSPANLATNVNRAAGLHFTWSAVTNAASYTFQLSTSSTFAFVNITTTSVSAFYDTLTTLNPNTKYYWRVRANSASGSSAWTVASFTTGP